MKTWQIALIIFGGIMLFRCLFNLERFLKIKWYEKKYFEDIARKNFSFLKEHKRDIGNTLSKAGVEDSVVPVVQPVGLGQVSAGHVSVRNNITSLRKDIVETMIEQFMEAQGVYRKRFLQSLNPLFWIEFLVFLPKYLLEYLGVQKENIGVKIGNVIWWFLCVIGTILINVFSSQISIWLNK